MFCSVDTNNILKNLGKQTVVGHLWLPFFPIMVNGAPEVSKFSKYSIFLVFKRANTFIQYTVSFLSTILLMLHLLCLCCVSPVRVTPLVPFHFHEYVSVLLLICAVFSRLCSKCFHQMLLTSVTQILLFAEESICNALFSCCFVYRACLLCV